MEKIFEKFGIYDFMGIWGPGAIAITYYLFTARSFFSELFLKTNISQIGISQGYIMIILYTVVAYTVGMILHEIGKLIFDRLRLFNFENISYFDDTLAKKKSFLSFNRIRYEYNRAIKQTRKNGVSLKDVILKTNQIIFEDANSELKYYSNLNTKRIDKYHSVYALSRSLSIAFIFHIACAVLSFLPCFTTIHIVIITLDFILAYIFFERSYRYFLSWIKNTYIQYFLCIYSQIGDTNESDKTTKIDI